VTGAVVVASIVEGHGEVEAVPVLVRRIAGVVAPGVAVVTPRPVRLKKGKLNRPGELERAVRLAAERVSRLGGVLVLFDADEDCPAQVAPTLHGRCVSARSDVPVSVVLAKREFEAWFVAAAESLAGQRDLPHDLSAPDEPESIRGAKEWLSSHMPAGRAYSPTIDQPALAATFDLASTRHTSPSFDKLYRELERLLRSGRQETAE
jgi:hypothetical protein